MSEQNDCTTYREEFSAYLDGELTADEQTAIEQHLTECSDCLRSLDTMKKMLGMYDALPVESAPENLLESIHEELDETTVSFDRAVESSQRVSYKPVMMAAAMLALMAGVSYVAMQALNKSSNGRMEMAAEVAVESADGAAPLTAIQPDMSVQTKEHGASVEQIILEEEAFWNGEEASEDAEEWIPEDAVADSTAEPTTESPEAIPPHVSARIGVTESTMNKTTEVTSELLEKMRAERAKIRAELLEQFTRREDGLWVQKGYTDQPLVQLQSGTEVYLNIVFEKEYLMNLVRHTRDIIFLHEGKWYRIAHPGPLILDPIMGEPYEHARQDPNGTPPQL